MRISYWSSDVCSSDLVFKQAVTVLDRSARDVCAEAGVEIAEVDWLVPHQANVRILNFLARKLHVPTEKVVITVDSHANTSAASVPLALDAARRDGRVKPGPLVLMQGVGGGFTWRSEEHTPELQSLMRNS